MKKNITYAKFAPILSVLLRSSKNFVSWKNICYEPSLSFITKQDNALV